MDSINNYLKIEAMKNGLCKKWTEEWTESRSLKELACKFKEGLDFCIIHDYPSKEFIDENIDRMELATYGIYDGVKDFNVAPGSDVFVVQHGAKGVMQFSMFDAATIWVRHDSDVHIRVRDNAYVFIHVLDNCKVFVENASTSKVNIVRHRENCDVTYIGEVKIIQSNNRF